MSQLQSQMQSLPGYNVAMDYFNDYMDSHFNKIDPFVDEDGHKLKLSQDKCTKEEQKLWKSIQSQAWVHDQCFMGCGNQISGIGLVPLAVLILPGLGPVLMYILHARLIAMAEKRLNIPNKLIGKMQSNIFIDLIITFPPLIGSFFGWLHGCSTRNAGLIYQYMEFVAKQRVEGKTATYVAPASQVEEPVQFGQQPQSSRNLQTAPQSKINPNTYNNSKSNYSRRFVTKPNEIVVHDQQQSGFV
ncbi:uncharacterized protein RJT21DRAFT_116604 [Scheffersomyces amazonensis]|uniref:uncharacterized protein n=1 Tax=Scheffersomyces amazonensis TaxID=1078765 RepID=UPI00315C8F90